MNLRVQIVALLASFSYGMFFYLVLELSFKIIYSGNLLIKIFGTFLFVLFHSLLYFLLLMRINNGYVHNYFFLCLLVGYLLCKVFHKRFVKYRGV